MFSIHKVKMAVDKHRKQHLHFSAANIGFWSLRKEEKFLRLNFIDSLRQDSEKRSKLEEKLLNNNPFNAMFSTTKKIGVLHENVKIAKKLKVNQQKCEGKKVGC